ncbi:hypothetical protein ISR94_00275 [Candidatus Microgenomates bacterium]|nr:hypothetical protein [Candidatus Microgenomates bacterium]
MQNVFDEQIIQLQPRGVFTIPKKLREGLFDDMGIAKIMRLGRKLVIEPVRTLPYQARSYTDDELGDFYKLDDKETKKLRAKGII